MWYKRRNNLCLFSKVRIKEIKAMKFLKNLFCKHKAGTIASCPFTGYTYTTCDSCGKITNAEETK